MKAAAKAFMKRLGKFTPVGHRGAQDELPGNTMEAFRRLVDIFPGGMIELDVWETYDGRAAVYHDRLLDHETGGSGPISALTYASLKSIDRGYRISHDGGVTFPFRGKGYTIPLLEEVLQGFPDSPISIDIKCHKKDFASRVMGIVKEHGAQDRVIMGSFSGGIISFIRKNYPRAAVSCGRNEVILFYAMNRIYLWKLMSFKGDALMIPEFTGHNMPEYMGGGVRQGFRIITPEFIKRAHELRVPVFAWTINNRDNMKRLISWGVDGIVTDYPSLLKEVMEEEGIGC